MSSDFQDLTQDLIQRDYRKRLKTLAIPLDPGKRTADQATQASLEFWGAQHDTILAANCLTQADADAQGGN